MGLNMWAAGKLGMCYELSLLHALTFGALISATDPVTVLAVFQQLGAQPDLYMNVFGESVLNDAVAMVLFQTLSGFADQGVAVSAVSILRGVGVFVGVFVGSLLLGVLMGFAAAAALRPGWFAGEVNNETGLMLLLGYASYMAGTAAGGSGIVCVMFCAMVAGGYAAPNLSPGGLQASRVLYAVLASVMEVYVFIAVGLSLFMQPQEWHMLRFLAVCLLGLAWSRAVNVLPSCAAVNYLRPPEMAIPPKQQLLLWWAGLRGAMAFALSVEAARTMGEPGKMMMTATFMSILCTVLVNGGSTGYLLAYCGLTHKQQQQHLPHEQEHVALLLPKEHSSSASLADTAGSSSSGAAASAASEFPLHRLRSSSHAADGSDVTPGELRGASLRQATPALPAARPSAGSPSEAGLLEALREANRHGLQARLDSWHASLFSRLINPESAAEHARWQAVLAPQQQQ